MRVALMLSAVLASGCFTAVAEQCKSKRCLADGGREVCSQGSVRECGSAVGICKAGRQTCQSDGVWGRCIGAVEPGVEVCDGKDNNCDGVIDEGVGRMCPLQKGVCAGASAACGGDGGCAYGPSYEVVESSCDGLDNDCDGVVDRTGAVNVSQSMGVVSRNPVAVKAPGSDAVIVLWEEGSKIAARVLRADGTMSPVVSPADTVDSATRAFAPALAADGTVVVAAWAEEAASVTRVMVATLDPATGRSNVMGGTSLTTLTADVTELSLAVDQAASRLSVGFVDAAGVHVRGFAGTLPMSAPVFSIDPVLANTRGVHLASLGGGELGVGLEHTDGRMFRTRIDAMGTMYFSSQQPMGQTSHLFAADAGMGSLYLGGTGTSKRVVAGLCVNSGSQISCVDGAGITPAGDLSALRVSSGQLAAWQEGTASPQVVQLRLDAPDAGTVGPGRRPSPVLLSNQSAVVFDTEGVTSTSVQSDEVYISKSCR